jgi:XTP/dITP diphosphohydrolase
MTGSQGQNAPLRVVLATRNKGKIAELHDILAAAGFEAELVGSDDLDVPDVEETGDSFAANALLKAVETARATGLPAVADDSGLCVDALNGMPGIFSARWSGSHGRDDANLDLVLAQVSDVPAERRGARFVCAAAAALPDGRSVVVEGELVGSLLRTRQGSGGFGYDPIFLPTGSDRTTAEMTSAEKNAISHRGKAFRLLAVKLPELLG